MFTGIIKAMGRIERMTATDGDVRLTVRSDGLPWRDYAIGDSISVNGVCLTVIDLHDDGFDTDVSNETLDVTALQSLETGALVNLEPALAAGERLGGHLVSGHVDCTGRVTGIREDARSLRFEFELPQEFARYVARKGSICIDGVSLTINSVKANGFSVNIIPHTAEVTSFGSYQSGTVVNIEVDLVARYLERLLMSDEGGLDMEKLKAHGYA